MRIYNSFLAKGALLLSATVLSFGAAELLVVGPPTDTFGYGVCHSVMFQHRWEMVPGNLRPEG